MPHVNLRRTYVISEGLRRRAPFPAIATASSSVAAKQATATAAPAHGKIQGGLTPAMIGASISAVVATLIIVVVILYKFRARIGGKGKDIKVPVNEKSSSTEEVKVDLYRASSNTLEKPKAVYLSEPTTTYDTQVGWTPQIKEYNGIPVTSKQFEKNMRYPRALAMWEKTQTAKDGSLKQSPTSSDTRSRSPSPTGSPHSPPVPKPAPKPSELTIPTPGLDKHLPSPMRSASLANQASLASKPATFSPRMMTVCNTFIPTLNDEIPVTIGESVCLLEEYDDGWCLAQSVGSKASKGIIPRFCLTERRR